MTVDSMDRVARARDVSDAVRTRSSLSRIDYADQFTLATNLRASPEQWARAMFGNTPSVAERIIWRGFLGLRLRYERSPATVGGWRVSGGDEDWIRLEAGSWFLSGVMVVLTDDDGVSWATLLRYERGIGHVVWPPLSAIHRWLVPRVLRAASARIRARY